MTTINISCNQLYQLFGYNRKITLSTIFGALLYSIAPIDINAPQYPPMFSGIDGRGFDEVTLLFMELRKAKDELPKYWQRRFSVSQMQEIDAKMKLLNIKEKELMAIPWYAFKKRWQIKRECLPLKLESLPIALAFQYLEYRASQDGLRPEKLRKLFDQFAEKFPLNN